MDRVGDYALVAVFGVDELRETDQGEFCGLVGAHAGGADVRADGGEVDDLCGGGFEDQGEECAGC